MQNFPRSVATAICVTAASILVTACSTPDADTDTIARKFAEPDLDARPMARMWFPDAGSGGDPNDLIARQINAMAEGGFGGVEMAMIGDETRFTNAQAPELAWGTPNWLRVMKKTLTAANARPEGFKVDITITAHWPPNVNTIDPNDETASMELSSALAKITAVDSVPLPMPAQKTRDSRRTSFVQTDRLVDAYIARVQSVDDGRPVLDYASIANISAQTARRQADSGVAGRDYLQVGDERFAGHRAGIPDRAAAEELAEAAQNESDEPAGPGGFPAGGFPGGGPPESGLPEGAPQAGGPPEGGPPGGPGEGGGFGGFGAFGGFPGGPGGQQGPVTADSILEGVADAFGAAPASNDFDGKFDVNGLRKRMADWQFYYDASLQAVPALDGYQPSAGDDIAAGDWVIVGVYRRGTGQVSSGGAGNPLMLNRPYVPDYFSRAGIQTVLDYWNTHFLNDAEFLALLQDNSGSIFEDSIEASHTGPFWTQGLTDRFADDYPYRALLPLAVAASARNSRFQISGPLAGRIVEDYNLELGKLYASEHAAVISDWAGTFGYDYRAQGYSLTGLDIAGAAAALDVPEGDNASDGDGLRNLSAAVNLYDKKFLSMEAITTTKVAASWKVIASVLNGNWVHGVNRVILHGTPYAKTFDNNNTVWPGWSWGGGGSGIGQFTSWNQRQIYWEDVRILSDYMSRNQVLMQNGKARVDLAVLNSQEASYRMPGGNSLQDTLDRGYSYNVLSGAVLGSPNAVVSNARLYASGPAYRALVLHNVTTLSVETLARVLQHARDGLPVVFVGELPQRVYGTEAGGNTDAELARNLTQLRELANVKLADSASDLPSALTELGVSPAARYQQAGLESAHRQDADGIDYYYFYNATDETIETDVVLASEGAPYILDAWTGRVQPAARYEQVADGVRTAVRLLPHETRIVALASPAVAADAGWSTSPGNADAATGGEAQTLPAPLDLGQSGWTLRLESFGPDDSAANLDAEGDMIDPTRHKRSVLEFADIGLRTWNTLDVTPDQLGSLGSKFNEVTSMSQVSGIGYYIKSFNLPADWDGSSARLRFGHGEDMLTSVKVNDVTFDRINPFSDQLDIGEALHPGADNVIEIKLDTTLRNRISLETGFRKSSFVTGELETANGLTSVVLEPYM